MTGELGGGGALPVVAMARDACPACPLYAMCPLAPVFLQVEAPAGARKPHPHGRTLELFLARMRQGSDNHERDLLTAMSGADEGLALVAGCLLAQEHWGSPARLITLLETINARAARAAEKAGQPRMLAPLEEQLQRAAAIVQDPAVPRLLSGAPRLKRPDREVTALEAMRLMSRLVAGENPSIWWAEAVAPEDRGSFEASFAMRDKGLSGDDSQPIGSLDLFFSARAGGRSAAFYYRRDAASGKQAIVPVEGVRADSLLKRLFKVFDTDRKKTHRLFGKICRGLNNGYKQLDKKMLWEGLKQLDREHLVVLALYAPRVGKFVEKRAEFPGLYRLVKFLHMNVADDENGIPSHVKVFERRAQVGTILETYGKEPFMRLCRALFRIAESYREGPESADIVFKIAEVCYLLTAVEGFNQKGLEVSLAGRNALAFIAFGLQPAAAKDVGPGRRYRRLLEARRRVESEGKAEGNGNGGGGDAGLPSARERAAVAAIGGPSKKELLTAIDQGFAYMAAIHGLEDVDALAKAAAAGPVSSEARPGAGAAR